MATDSPGEQMKRLRRRASRPLSSEAADHTAPPKRRKALWRRTRRVLLGCVLLIALLALAGFLYQTIASALGASRYPPPGKLIDVGGYRLHLSCTGTDHPASPTVILEAGLGDTSLAWSKVQPGVAAFTRVCSYDRAGWGWSDNGPQPRTAGRMVAELHTLLTRAGVPGPYVLVGHSFGGVIMRLYAYTYPQEVAGLVLVDSMHEDQFVRSPKMQQDIVNGRKLLSICQALAPFGIVRLLGYFNAALAAYPPSVQPAVKAHYYPTRYCSTNADEQASLDESFAQVRVARHPLGHLPLVVLTHGLPIFPDPQEERDWQALQRDLVGLSSNSIQIIATHSGHHIQLDQPELVIAAIKQVLTGKV